MNVPMHVIINITILILLASKRTTCARERKSCLQRTSPSMRVLESSKISLHWTALVAKIDGPERGPRGSPRPRSRFPRIFLYAKTRAQRQNMA